MAEKKPKAYEQPKKLVERPDYTEPARCGSHSPKSEKQWLLRRTSETKDPSAHRPELLE